MNDATLPPDAPAHTSHAETMSALFAHMVIQQANTALMLLGKVPDPQSGQTLQDLEAAKLFIDQLEMLEVKTKGNLDPKEQKLLKQSLASVRMAFVEVVEAGPSAGSPSGAGTAAAGETAKSTAQASHATAPAAEESRKKFTKKY